MLPEGGRGRGTWYFPAAEVLAGDKNRLGMGLEEGLDDGVLDLAGENNQVSPPDHLPRSTQRREAGSKAKGTWRRREREARSV